MPPFVVAEFRMRLADYDRENPHHIQKLQDLSSKDERAHLRMYHDAIREKAAEVQIPEDVLQLLTELEDKYRYESGAKGDVFCYARQTKLSFIEAYLTARFGEDPRVWPEEIDWDAEKGRVTRWLDGRSPAPQTFRVES